MLGNWKKNRKLKKVKKIVGNPKKFKKIFLKKVGNQKKKGSKKKVETHKKNRKKSRKSEKVGN